MKSPVATVALVTACAALGCAQGLAGADDTPKSEPEEPTGKVIKTEEEWARQLTRAQFMVTRMKATEPAFSGKYVHTKVKGTFTCVGCGARLFSSKHKFESGTGWPSFWRPYSDMNIATAPDLSDGTTRVEVECSHCGGHLGHVFGDGPPPTGLRFCINSLALKLVPDAVVPPPAKKTAKSKATPKAKDDRTGKETKKQEDKPKDEPASKTDAPEAE